MSTSIRLSESAKAKLDRVKREDESHDELIDRLVSAQQPIDFGFLSEAEAETARAVVECHRQDYAECF
jgi:predicted CopG family antitoxin